MWWAMSAPFLHSPERVLAQVERILASREFSRSQRLCRFLRFAAQCSLAGEGKQLKEQVVGVEVFDRKIDYDPRIDPIVRVEARRLRSKLKSYYASKGNEHDLVIALPKGSYALVVEECPESVAAPPASAAPSSGQSVAHSIAQSDAQPGAQSIAVLPFANLSPDDVYFSDGLTEELIHRLTRIPNLRVVAWNTASQVRGREYDLQEIRRLLNVRTVLRGSVRRDANRVRVTTQLVESESGTVLWSEIYDRNIQSVFAIQDEIARAIVQALQLRFTSPRPTLTLNLAAYNLCLQGRFFANNRTKEGLQKSAERFEEAIRLDASSAQAHAGLADAYSLLADYGLLSPQEAFPKAKQAALHALDLDPYSAEANVSLAFVRSLFEWKWDEAETHYRTAIALNPGDSHARHWFGLDFLALLGRHEEAVVEVRLALDLDPLSSIIREGWGYVQTLGRDYDAALLTYQTVVDLHPDFYKGYASMGRVLSLMGRYSESLEAFEKARLLAGALPSLLAALGQTHALAGHTDQALELLRELESLRHTRWVPESCLAIVHLGLGDFETALKRLETAADLRELTVASLYAHPLYDPLHSEPSYHRLIRRIGFLP
jgi:TolB-like protein/Flp pilus assembly protein TadD